MPRISADEYDELLAVLTISGMIADGDYDPDDMRNLIPDDSGRPFLTAASLAGVSIRWLAAERECDASIIIEGLRQRILDSLASGESR